MCRHAHEPRVADDGVCWPLSQGYLSQRIVALPERLLAKVVDHFARPAFPGPDLPSRGGTLHSGARVTQEVPLRLAGRPAHFLGTPASRFVSRAMGVMAGNRWDKNGEGRPSRGFLARNSRGECLLRVSPAWRGLRGTSFPSRRFIIMATESRYERSPRESTAIRARNGSCLAANARNEYSHREFADTARVAGIFPDPSPGKRRVRLASSGNHLTGKYSHRTLAAIGGRRAGRCAATDESTTESRRQNPCA